MRKPRKNRQFRFSGNRFRKDRRRSILKKLLCLKKPVSELNGNEQKGPMSNIFSELFNTLNLRGNGAETYDGRTKRIDWMNISPRVLNDIISLPSHSDYLLCVFAYGPGTKRQTESKLAAVDKRWKQTNQQSRPTFSFDFRGTINVRNWPLLTSEDTKTRGFAEEQVQDALPEKCTNSLISLCPWTRCGWP